MADTRLVSRHIPEITLSQSHSSRRRRGRGRGRGSSSQAAEHQASIQDSLFEDPQTFWARSNARLGMDAAYYGNTGGKNGRGGKPPVDFPCAVCGEWVLLERWAKDRHDVRCENCKQAVGQLLSGEDKQIANEMRRERKAAARGKYDGLPEMSEEDVEAVREMRAIADAMGNGRVGNRRGKGGGKSGRRRRKGGGQSSGDSRRKGGRRRGRGGGNGGGGNSGGKRSGGRGRGGRGRGRRNQNPQG